MRERQPAMAGDDSSENVTFGMSEDLVEEVDGQLEYGDSRSAWIRQAVKERLKRDVWNGERDEREVEA